jgi:hypothetical protein
MVTFKHSMQKLIAKTLVILMSMLVLNNIIFIHSHILPNGRIITHAHPYNPWKDSSSKAMHSHSANEFIHLSHLQILFLSSLFSFLFITGNAIRLTAENQIPARKIILSKQRGRSPPFAS